MAAIARVPYVTSHSLQHQPKNGNVMHGIFLGTNIVYRSIQPSIRILFCISIMSKSELFEMWFANLSPKRSFNFGETWPRRQQILRSWLLFWPISALDAGSSAATTFLASSWVCPAAPGGDALVYGSAAPGSHHTAGGCQKMAATQTEGTQTPCRCHHTGQTMGSSQTPCHMPPYRSDNGVLTNTMPHATIQVRQWGPHKHHATRHHTGQTMGSSQTPCRCHHTGQTMGSSQTPCCCHHTGQTMAVLTNTMPHATIQVRQWGPHKHHAAATIQVRQWGPRKHHATCHHTGQTMAILLTYLLMATIQVRQMGSSQTPCHHTGQTMGSSRLAYSSALGGSLPHLKASFRPPAFSQNLPLSIKIWSTCVSGLDSDPTDLLIDQLPWSQQSTLPIN